MLFKSRKAAELAERALWNIIFVRAVAAGDV
jgi:hypothetical protein